MTPPDARAVAANRERYAGDEVAGYLREEYHRVRIELAVGLVAGLLTGRPGAGRGPAGDRRAGQADRRTGSRAGSRPVVADLGAGGGLVCAMLADRGLCAVACDNVPEAVRAARAAGHAAVDLDASSALPFRSGSLDGILAGELIEHLFDPALLLRECRRVLRPGGVLVVTTPNLAAAQDRVRFLAGRSPRQVDPFHPYLYLHIRPFTYSLLAAGLRGAGLRPVRLRSNHVVWRTRRGEVRSRLAARVWPGLGGSLIIAAVAAPGERRGGLG